MYIQAYTATRLGKPAILINVINVNIPLSVLIGNHGTLEITPRLHH